MSKKRKVPERPEDCVTIADKVAFSNMMRERYDKLAEYDSKPSDILDFDRFPPLDPRYPWMHPEWAADFSRSEREKARVLGQRAKRRMLNG